MSGKIIKIISNLYTVLYDNKTIDCHVRGKFRNMKITPMVGDMVVFDEKQNIIEQILPRKNELIRPSVSNIDQAIVVVSVKDPDLDLYLLDKLLCIIEFNSIQPIICFTKLDLLENTNEIDKIKAYYQKIGYPVYDNQDNDIKTVFQSKVTVFTGQSGAGKSTLLNLLDEELNLQTGEISKALGRGKHTTRHVELLPLLNGMCIDTPGFSSVSFIGMSKSDIRDNMIEFNEYKQDCQYRDCMHDKEIDCSIKKRVGNDILPSRYENYLQFLKEGDS